jgi:hypothetical protein
MSTREHGNENMVSDYKIFITDITDSGFRLVTITGAKFEIKRENKK